MTLLHNKNRFCYREWKPPLFPCDLAADCECRCFVIWRLSFKQSSAEAGNWILNKIAYMTFKPSDLDAEREGCSHLRFVRSWHSQSTMRGASKWDVGEWTIWKVISGNILVLLVQHIAVITLWGKKTLPLGNENRNWVGKEQASLLLNWCWHHCTKINTHMRQTPEVNRITHEQRMCNHLSSPHSEKALNLSASFPPVTKTGVIGLTWFSQGFWDLCIAPELI